VEVRHPRSEIRERLASLLNFVFCVAHPVRAPASLVEQAVLLALFLVFLLAKRFEGRLLGFEFLLEFVEGRVGVVDLGLDLGEFGLPRDDFALAISLLDFEAAQVVVEIVDAFVFPVDLDERPAAFGFGFLDALLCGLDLVFEPGDLAFDLLDFALDSELLVLALPLDFGVEFLEFVLESLEFPGCPVQRVRFLFEFALAGVDTGLRATVVGAFVLEFGSPEVAFVLLFLRTQLLVLEGRLALLAELVEAVFFLHNSQVGFADPLLNDFEFLASRLLLRVERRDARDLVDDAPALVGRHVDDLGHVALHHHVVPLRRDAGLCQQILNVREVRRPTVEVVVGVVVILGLLNPALDPNLLDVADVLAAGGLGNLRAGEGAFTVVEHYRHGGLTLPAGRGALAARVVDEVSQLLRTDAACAGEAEREQHPVDNVGLS